MKGHTGWSLAKSTSHVTRDLPRDTQRRHYYDKTTTRRARHSLFTRKTMTTEIVQMFIDTIATKHDVCNSALTETPGQIVWPIPKKM